MWGQVSGACLAGEYNGIIPTRVGTSENNKKDKYTSWDHPHACGDKRNIAAYSRSFRGSSPRVWGQAYACGKLCELCRIIPTRVGTSPAIQKFRLISEDHPHACGDKLCCRCLKLCIVGSSPRVWGQGL